jgi:membrane protein
MIASMSKTLAPPAALSDRLADMLSTLRSWPWFDTLRTLRQRFREDRLGLTASSLTFTTLISLVPLATVMLAVFAAFPMFAGLEPALERYFLQNLVPDGIAKPVLKALTQFAAKARGLGTAGLAILVFTALALVLTIDRTLNALWRVRRPRPFGQRVLVYWAALTLGPLVLGLSLTLTGWALAIPAVAAGPWLLNLLIDAVQFVLLAAATAALFHYVPNAPVRWRHAWAGGVFVAVAFELAKKLLSLYLAKVPTYSTMYGAFATVPILMLWVYLGWLIVLLGAVIAAYAPSLQMRVARRAPTPGWRFELALAVLRQLQAARVGGHHGLALPLLARELRAEPQQLEGTLETLCQLDWVQRLDENGPAAPHGPRWVLLCNPAQTPLLPLLQACLLQPGPASARFEQASGWPQMTLAQALI